MIDWEHYRAEWISLCHQYQLDVITTSKHQPIQAAWKAAGSPGAGLLVKPDTDFGAVYEMCLQQAVLPALGCAPSAAQRSLPASPLPPGIPGSGGGTGYQQIWDSGRQETFTYRSADPILMVFPEELKSLLAFYYG